MASFATTKLNLDGVLAGGYTVAGEVEGAWRLKDGTKQVDRSAQYWVVVDEGQIQELKALVATFTQLLGQEAMYLERVEGFVEFIQPPAEED